MDNFFSGTSGLVLPGPKDTFPVEFQQRPRLEYYASLFNSIEINSSFYKLPLRGTVRKWAEIVPESFRFTFKLSKSVTHEKGKKIDPGEITRFMNVVNEVETKAGCILVQFPPGAGRDVYALAKILDEIASNDLRKWIIAVEFRNLSWYSEDTYRLLEKFNASLVFHDIPGKSPPADEYESGNIYLRFHGPQGTYRGSYDAIYLEEYAQYLKNFIREGKTVYAYFNNTMGEALKNLECLNTFMRFK
jgi:uncharacterized protein YecE (DUF72 family)